VTAKLCCNKKKARNSNSVDVIALKISHTQHHWTIDMHVSHATTNVFIN